MLTRIVRTERGAKAMEVGLTAALIGAATVIAVLSVNLG